MVCPDNSFFSRGIPLNAVLAQCWGVRVASGQRDGPMPIFMLGDDPEKNPGAVARRNWDRDHGLPAHTCAEDLALAPLNTHVWWVKCRELPISPQGFIKYVSSSSSSSTHIHERYSLIMLRCSGKCGSWISVWSEIMSYVWDVQVQVFHVVNDVHVSTVCNSAASHIYFVRRWAERDSVGGVRVLCFVVELWNACSTHTHSSQQNILSLLVS